MKSFVKEVIIKKTNLDWLSDYISEYYEKDFSVSEIDEMLQNLSALEGIGEIEVSDGSLLIRISLENTTNEMKIKSLLDEIRALFPDEYINPIKEKFWHIEKQAETVANIQTDKYQRGILKAALKRVGLSVMQEDFMRSGDGKYILYGIN